MIYMENYAGNFNHPRMKYSQQDGLISVIVPIYNSERYLNKCLDSILAQTFENWEAILVNDGSTDSSGLIVDEYVKNDSRFIAVHKKNEGTLLARKTGLENSKGEFIANIDNDDYYDPDFLKKMYDEISEDELKFLFNNYIIREKKFSLRLCLILANKGIFFRYMQGIILKT